MLNYNCVYMFMNIDATPGSILSRSILANNEKNGVQHAWWKMTWS